ncbi:hypothetical protein EIP75_14140 [Aquabacterium soli]|uniref:Uncharacterized protein n=1 Tax=Aquabacterium soli TaxID=2493092 RepID=A0A3R8TB70_9BURK|nr:hypothetical protein [Aquabacterium soli]RRS03725.1 hypothetical protein EIP75_14140 [Aquabacterium soli]
MTRRLHSLRVQGQAMVEYVVVVAAITAALFVPIADDASGGTRLSAIQLLVRGFQTGYAKISSSLSAPE